MKKQLNSKQIKRKYNLHYKIRKQGFKLDTKARTITQHHSKPNPQSKQLNELIHEFGYVIQLTF
jgi:hypothetical protein